MFILFFFVVPVDYAVTICGWFAQGFLSYFTVVRLLMWIIDDIPYNQLSLMIHLPFLVNLMYFIAY